MAARRADGGVKSTGLDVAHDPSAREDWGTSPYERGGSRHDPIVPPSFFVIATIDGRGGRLSLKSGQRVDGLSNDEPLSSPAGWIRAGG